MVACFIDVDDVIADAHAQYYGKAALACEQL